MIRNENEYQEALKRLKEDEHVISTQKQAFLEMGLNNEQINRGLAPMLTFHQQLEDEIKWYERVKRGDIEVIQNITDLGKGLIALRIARGMTQKELAQVLGTTEAQVSRDERNDYHGVGLERAQRIVDAIHGARIKIEFLIDDLYQEKALVGSS